MGEDIQGVRKFRPCLKDIGYGTILGDQEQCVDGGVGFVCECIREGTE